MGNGHKLKAGRKDRERKPQSIGELVGGPIRANKESGGASTWLPKKVREWLEVLDMVAIARGKEARRACQVCSKEAVVLQEGLALCRACNDHIPRVERGKEWEGFC